MEKTTVIRLQCFNGGEMAMKELMSMMTEAAKLVHYNKEQKNET